MSSSSVSQVIVELTDVVTPQVFALMLEKTIAYINYCTNLLPVNYDILRRLMKKRRSRMAELIEAEDFSEAYRELECGGQYNAIEQIYNAYEATFSNIQNSLVNDKAVREIAIVVGHTLMPKHVYLILVPQLSYSHPDPMNCSARLIRQLFRSLITTLNVKPIERIQLEASIFLGVDSETDLSGDWFSRKEFFYHPKTPLTVIVFDVQTGPSFHIHEDNRDLTHEEDELAQSYDSEVKSRSQDNLGNIFLKTDRIWYGGKLGLKGFRVGKMKGESLLDRLQRLLH